MKTTPFFLASLASLATAQLRYDGSTNTYICAEANQAYCVTDSMAANIIVRCGTDATGIPGNCDDNLDGEPPSGLAYSPCWQSSNSSGDAACSKNCIVYGGSGNYNGTFTMSGKECKPTYTASASSSSATSSTRGGGGGYSSPTSSSAGTTTASVSNTTAVETSTATTRPGSGSTTATSSGAAVPSTPSSAASSAASLSTAGGNSTITISGAGTATAVSSASSSAVTLTAASALPTAGAVTNRVSAGLGVVGLIIGALL